MTLMKSMLMRAWKKTVARLERLSVAWACAAAGLLSSCVSLPQDAPFSARVVEAVRSMPSGGGYAGDRAAEVRLAERGVVWCADEKKLVVSPLEAAPTFCSAACYEVLLLALEKWQAVHPQQALSPRVWENLRVEVDHPDGYLSWGRVNANGPGLAKWVHDVGAGVNFSSPEAAQPGDFLKFFHTPEIGARERGHLVVFLGLEQKDGETRLRYWSSNRPGGYGERSVPLSKLHHPIFTRITRPERMARVLQLPVFDSWLSSMLMRAHSYEEVVQKCGVRPR